MDELTPFVPDGTRILEAVFGDLDDDGRPDVLLVLDPPRAPKERWGQCPAREVVLLVRDAQGFLCKVASNDRIVPGASGGGVAGDPFGYVVVAPGSFTIVNGGGGRTRWWDEFTFAWAADRQDWFVSRVSRQVADSHSGEERQAEWSGNDLGETSFAQFDPAQMPEVVLP